MNPRIAAAFGIGFGPRQMASFGMSSAAFQPAQPARLKVTPVAFDIPGEVIFVPWPKRTPNVNPNDSKPAISQDFDGMEQALMLFAVASLNS